MKVLILAAGYGTRLYPLVTDTPKSLLDVQGQPLINYIVRRVEKLSGLNEILVVTNNKFFKVFQNWAAAQTQCPVKIKIINDETKSPDDRLGSVGDIHFVIQQGSLKEDLLVVGGDNLFTDDLSQYFAFAHKKSPGITIGIYDIHDRKEARKFGVVDIDNYGRITSFEEKPEAPRSSLIAMCVYYFPQATVGLVAEYLKESIKADKAGDYIKWLCSKKEVYGFAFHGKWYDIGSIESYREAQEKFIA
ncbi:MAG: hypothetical protein A2787_06335 [Omnitrophica WOR_2 bacterium RIFCSPHIGHO2_01_FULL_48_9]|nr:MAG: hypothetical protein A3D10_03100 [Omnitrophica WOR_2 bacterium RIFCSPHIGHO2_02_FULL_48_11]OGX34524.1 MAG: hypothetical protein A2787_06335 [Omnitrophica WOR_2 bacterium RIFCSPHIGHO2_01_FULL_48_9]